MTPTRTVKRLRLLLPAFVFSLLPCFAQFDGGTVLGTIGDPTGGAVPNAKVILLNIDTGVADRVISSTDGSYQFLEVRIGRYNLTAQANGFKSSSTEPFAVTVGAHQKVDVSMQIGDVNQSVTIQDAASALESESSDRGQVVAAEQILNLPLNGRAYADLALLAPGVRRSALGNMAGRDGSYNVNGVRSAYNNYIIDGVDNNAYGTSNQGFSYQVVQASPDAVQEFRIETSNFSAEYGRAAGAVVNTSIRSGSNQFHGAAWDFLRNTDLNATGYFKPAGGAKPVLIQNQFGGALGGPIRRDKLFFFADYEGIRSVSRTLSFLTFPTQAQRAGSFGIPLQNPYTGQVYADGNIPASLITPFARKVLSDLPAQNLAGTSNNYQTLPAQQNPSDKGDARIDEYLSDQWTIFGRYSHRVAVTYADPTIPGASGLGVDIKRSFNQQVVFGSTWTPNARSLVDFRFGFSRTQGSDTRQSEIDDSGNMLSIYGIPGLPTNKPIAGGLNSQAISGYTSYGRDSGQHQNPTVINPKVNYSRVQGRHTLKAGFEYQAVNTEIVDFNPMYGKDTYAGQFSRPKSASSNSVYNVADFLLGARDSYNLNSYGVLQYRQRMYFGYVQDDFKISRKLTLNTGLRYELGTPQWEEDNHLSNFDPTTNTLAVAKNGSLYDRSLVHPDTNNWAPRVGFAYSLTPKTVIRSAYGISYVHFQRYGRENLLGYNPPYVINVLVNQAPSQGLCPSAASYANCFLPTQSGYPANLATPANFNAVGTNIHYLPSNSQSTYVQSWHFTVQQQLARDWVLDVAYVGNHGVHILLLGDYNQAAPNVAGQSLGVDQRRPIGGFGIIQAAFPAGLSSYQALQTKLEKRFSRGLYLLNSFTWSKTIDTAPGNMEAAGGDNYPVNYRNWNSNRALSDLNQPFNNTTSLVWNLPVGRGQRFGSGLPAWADTAVGGWNLSVINTMTSGLPVTITYSPTAAFSVSSLPTYRPNLTGSIDPPAGQATIDHYFNTANISAPTDVTQPFGNAGRNIGRSPAFYQLDLGLHKRFALRWESKAIEFRTEMFNALNKTNFQAPASNISASTFGTIRSTFAARQVQFAAKFIF